MSPATDIVIRRVARLRDRTVVELGAVLLDCVEGGASVGFMAPLTAARAEAYWRGLSGDIAAARRILLVAEIDSRIVGTVQLVPAPYENQPHRADVSKLLVHREFRGRGVGAGLMAAVEQAARESGRWLLVLDTATPEAERIYLRQGWQAAGTVPDYALMPGGALTATHIYYRKLR